jgi:DNA-binding protein HU-beta
VTKTHLVDRIADATGLTRVDVGAVVDGLLYSIAEAVAAGEAVELRGFGTFRPQRRAARTARDPRTQVETAVPPRVVPVFRPGASFRRAVADPPAE